MVSFCRSAHHHGNCGYTNCPGRGLVWRLVGFCRVCSACGVGGIRVARDDAPRGVSPAHIAQPGSRLLFLIAAMFPQQRMLLLEIDLSMALVVTFPLLFFRKRLDGTLLDWALTLAIALYLGWPLSLLPLLRGYQVGISPGFWWVLAVLVGCWGFDTGAFFAGHFFGRHKLAPRISPAKSWEGVVGGLIFSIIASVLLTVRPL